MVMFNIVKLNWDELIVNQPIGDMLFTLLSPSLGRCMGTKPLSDIVLYCIIRILCCGKPYLMTRNVGKT